MGKQLSPPVNIPPGIVVDVTIPVGNNTKELIVPGAGCPKGISGKPCVPPGRGGGGGGGGIQGFAILGSSGILMS